MSDPLTAQHDWSPLLTPAPFPKTMEPEDYAILKHIADSLPQGYQRTVYGVSSKQQQVADMLRRAGLLKGR